jgi:phosphoglycolate phosphatase-like HAD superfamily hydrolase
LESDLGKNVSSVTSILNSATLIFWDFDGVIKDSVEVKTSAFENLFSRFGENVTSRVRQHHESHGGVSRFEKIPLYLTWANEPATPAKVEEYCDRFSSLVLKAVIDSHWVPGVREYLLLNSTKQYFVLVTATPQDEIQQILAALEIAHCFHEVHGAPRYKARAINDVLARISCAPANALMIGDSEMDLKAAQANSVPFLLRRTPLNLSIQATYTGPMFDDLSHE